MCIRDSLWVFRILPTASLGVVLGLLVVWTGSLWPAALAHFLNNVVGLMMTSWEVDDEAQLLPIALVSCLLGVALLHRIWRTRR